MSLINKHDNNKKIAYVSIIELRNLLQIIPTAKDGNEKTKMVK